MRAGSGLVRAGACRGSPTPRSFERGSPRRRKEMRWCYCAGSLRRQSSHMVRVGRHSEGMPGSPIERFGAPIVELFAHPAGRAARPMARVLNFFNRQTGQRAAAALGVTPGQRVLEIGFGGGAAIPTTLRALDQQGQLCAVDLSQDMVAVAGQRFSEPVRQGRLVLACSEASALPFHSRAFDRAYALHSHMYWPSLMGGINEMYRVLAPGGQLLLAMDTVAGIALLQRFGGEPPQAGMNQLAELFTQAGLTQVTTQRLARGVVAVSGTRP